ncbi:MAG: LysE family transporter [Bacteroidales bacterium]|nr:LysE family transporter [Bacteroidales bacterium]
MEILDPHLLINNIWAEFQSTFQLVIKGLIIGIVVSAPMGPTGILCIQRTMNKGREYGLVTGAGAATSDLFYAIITGFGMSFVMDFISQAENIFWLKVAGSIILFFFGIITFRSNPTKKLHTPSGQKGTLLNNYISAFLVTVANPLIIFLFIALFAQFTFVVPTNFLGVVFGYLSIIAGAMLWWFGLTHALTKMKHTVGEKGLVLMNRIIGGVVIFASIIYAFTTIFKISLRFYNLPEIIDAIKNLFT